MPRHSSACCVVVLSVLAACGGRNQLPLPGLDEGDPQGAGGFVSDGGSGPGVGPGGVGGAGGLGVVSAVGVGGGVSTTVGPGVTSVTATGAGGFGQGGAGVGGFGTSTGQGGFGQGGAGTGGFGQGGSGAGGGVDPVGCLTCIAGACPQAAECLTNPTCINGSICAVQGCFANGSPDFGCVLQCFNGDLGAAVQAFQAVQCAVSSCPDVCGGFGF